jgi:hypothetical protein
MKPNKHTRKEPCQVCNVVTGSRHNPKCAWAYEKQPDHKFAGVSNIPRHNFVESAGHGNEYNVVIYCKWCGKVIWHFNKSDKSVEVHQKDIKEPCIYLVKGELE